MGNSRNIFNPGKGSAAYAYVKPQSGQVTVAKATTIKSHLAFRSTADLNKSRCAAYSYLIP